MADLLLLVGVFGRGIGSLLAYISYSSLSFTHLLRLDLQLTHSHVMSKYLMDLYGVSWHHLDFFSKIMCMYPSLRSIYSVYKASERFVDIVQDDTKHSWI